MSLTLQQIESEVLNHFKIGSDKLRLKCHGKTSQEIVKPRQICIYLMVEFTDLTRIAIARYLSMSPPNVTESAKVIKKMIDSRESLWCDDIYKLYGRLAEIENGDI
jgi:chromosomal replication initiation ATPase DnaA